MMKGGEEYLMRLFLRVILYLAVLFVLGYAVFTACAAV